MPNQPTVVKKGDSPRRRLVFAGTPEFSVPALDALLDAGHEIAGVYTQPDRPAGRGRRLTPSPVAMRAAALGVPVFKPEKFTAEAVAQLRDLQPEAMVVVAYGLLLPPAVLEIPVRGCFNIHASLLPRWRGAAPIQRAILAGDAETGITIMQMDAGLDTGAMLLCESIAIGPQQNAGELQSILSASGARMMVQALARLDALVPQAQPATGESYARKIRKEEARLDWSRPAVELARAVRGYNPAPVAWTELDGERVMVHRAVAAATGGAVPGIILAVDAGGLTVACGDGSLRMTEFQRAGGKVMSAALAPHHWIGRRFS